MTTSTRDRFSRVVNETPVDLGLACALIAADLDRDADPDAACARLDELASDTARGVPADPTPVEAAAALRRGLADRGGFRGRAEDYRDVRGSLLPDVLRRRHGLPILLSVVYVEVGRRLRLPVDGVGVPGHFVVGVGTGDDRVLIDPYDGARPTTPAELTERVAAFHPDAATEGVDLTAWPPTDIVRRVLDNIRGISAGVDGARTELCAVELALLLPHRPVSLRRDRGRLLARLGDFAAAANELDQYADAISGADPDAAARARQQSRLVRSRLS